MSTNIIAFIDTEIANLRRAKALLVGSPDALPAKRRGRPSGSGKAAVKAAPAKKSQRVLSPEARARIAAAQKKRWAAAKKAAQTGS